MSADIIPFAPTAEGRIDGCEVAVWGLSKGKWMVGVLKPDETFDLRWGRKTLTTEAAAMIEAEALSKRSGFPIQQPAPLPSPPDPEVA